MRKYMRKTQTKWSVISLRGAMNAVLSKKMGYKKASDLFHVPKTTLIRYIKKFKTANQTEPSTLDYPANSEVTPRSNSASETPSYVDSLIQHDSMSQPSSAKLQKKSERQMAFADSSLMTTQTQMHVPQHLQVTFSTPGPSQATFRQQEQVLAAPPQVAVARPVEKPRPREKRLLAIANHQRCVMSNLAALWRSGKLCDAGIGNGSTTVKVHKVVLSAVCPKLLSVFSADFFSQKFLQVNFPEEVTKEALKAFAEYMYKGVLDLDRNILEQMKIIAKRLDMKEFEELCDSHLPNYMHQPTSTTGSFTNFPVGQTTMPNPATPSSLGFAVSSSSSSSSSSSLHSAVPSITTQVIDVKQEISEAEMAQVKQDTAAVFGQESEVELLTPNKSGGKAAAGFIISPSVKTELVGPDDNKYGQWSGNKGSNQTFTSTPSYPSASASVMSIPASSSEFSIPFLEETNVKSTRLKVPHRYEPPLVSNLYPVSGSIDETVQHSQTTPPLKGHTSKSLSAKPISMLSIADQSTSTNNEIVYPVGLFTAGGDSLPLLTTPTVDINTIDLYQTDIT